MMKWIKRRLSLVNKRIKLISRLFNATTMLIAGCGKDEKDDEEETSVTGDSNEEEDKEEEKEEEKPEEEEDEDKEEKEEPESAGDDEIMNPQLAEETDGDVEVIFTNDDPGYTSDLDGLEVEVHKYQIVKITDMKKSKYIVFDENLYGYVVTIELISDETIYK